MDPVLLVRQGLLFAHIILFAVALGEIVRGDWRLLRGNDDFAALERTARVVTLMLAGLWISGLGLVWFDTGFDLAAIAAKPKLSAKLIVVLVLTANGALLHSFAFPALRRGIGTRVGAAIVASLGAISTVCWFMAAFMGQARIIASAMTLSGFLELFGVGLAAGVAVATVVVAPRLVNRRRYVAQVSDEEQWLADGDVPLVVPEAAIETKRAA